MCKKCLIRSRTISKKIIYHTVVYTLFFVDVILCVRIHFHCPPPHGLEKCHWESYHNQQNHKPQRIFLGKEFRTLNVGKMDKWSNENEWWKISIERSLFRYFSSFIFMLKITFFLIIGIKIEIIFVRVTPPGYCI